MYLDECEHVPRRGATLRCNIFRWSRFYGASEPLSYTELHLGRMVLQSSFPLETELPPSRPLAGPWFCCFWVCLPLSFVSLPSSCLCVVFVCLHGVHCVNNFQRPSNAPKPSESSNESGIFRQSSNTASTGRSGHPVVAVSSSQGFLKHRKMGAVHNTAGLS